MVIIPYKTMSNHSLKEIDARIDEIENERKRRLFIMRGFSHAVTILVLATSIVSILNDFIGFISPQQITSAIGLVVAFGDVMFEYSVRRRMALVDGRSQHLIEIRKKISEIHEILQREEAMRRSPGYVAELSTNVEVSRLTDALATLTGKLTYEDSLQEVIATSGVRGY